jgi:ubiquinone biosynthesis protein UbiJ
LVAHRPDACTLHSVTDALIELSSRLEDAAERMRTGDLEVDGALALIEECAQLASEASAQVDEHVRAALEPLPDLPGQLPLPAA